MSQLESLLDRIKKNRETIQEDFKGDTVREFISDFSIEEGIDKIPTYVLYYMYEFRFKTEGLKLKTTAFFRQFKKYFKQYRGNSQRYYLINKSKLLIDRKLMLEADNYAENKKINKTKKKRT